MNTNEVKKWIEVTICNFKEQDILYKKKSEQIEWLKKYGLKIGDIIKQDNYIHLEPFTIKWLKEYKCIGVVNKDWTAFHFFGDLFIPEKCKVLKLR